MNKSEPGTDRLWFEYLSSTKMSGLRLFCFPYAGGSAEIYRDWQKWFPPDIEVCLVHLPGHGKRIAETAFTRISALVSTLGDRMGPEIRTPYALCGHSMGALISFELSWELTRRYGAGPQHLFVAGRSAPQWPRNRPATFHLPDDEFLLELKRLNGTPRDVLENPDLMELFLGVLRADFELVETYEYQHTGPLDCPITVYSGLDDEDIPLEACQAWRHETTSICTIRRFKGDHFFIRDSKSEFVNVFRNDVLSAVSVWHEKMNLSKTLGNMSESRSC
jgi:medium-chain acyl-[acyl-carrier-protein] hydrolase